MLRTRNIAARRGHRAVSALILTIAALVLVCAVSAQAQTDGNPDSGNTTGNVPATATDGGASNPDSTADNAVTSLPPPPQSGWVRGRTTYYGGPDLLSKTYDPSRGAGSFGILAYGACGYTNSDGSLAFAPDAVAAAADADPDYPGSCGRCYQFKCVDGLVSASNNTPVQIINGFYDGDTLRPYLPAINSSIPDTQGRAWPGNPAESQGQQAVRCWDENQVITVRVIDSCPCRQVLSESAPGVKKGGEVRRQEWCCGGQNHFDLSYYAFERLAHPVYGVMSVDYQPVDCDTGEPLPPPPAPGYVSSVVYDNNIRPGWSWFPYSSGYFRLVQEGAGLDGSAATCVQVSHGGGLNFKCRWCGLPGYQPFKNANSISFWIRPNSNSSDPYSSSTPTGVVPPLKMFVMAEDSTGENTGQHYCNNEVYLNSTAPAEMRGDWFKIVVPISEFRCEGAVPKEEINKFEFQNINDRDAYFCLDQIQLDT